MESVGTSNGCYMSVQSSCLQDLAGYGLLMLFVLSGSRAAFCWFDGKLKARVRSGCLCTRLVEEDLDQVCILEVESDVPKSQEGGGVCRVEPQQ
ncbi:uncharacterized protein LOC144003692 isoform X3 [Festucalex cinctus]